MTGQINPQYSWLPKYTWLNKAPTIQYSICLPFFTSINYSYIYFISTINHSITIIFGALFTSINLLVLSREWMGMDGNGGCWDYD